MALVGGGVAIGRAAVSSESRPIEETAGTAGSQFNQWRAGGQSATADWASEGFFHRFCPSNCPSKCHSGPAVEPTRGAAISKEKPIHCISTDLFLQWNRPAAMP